MDNTYSWDFFISHAGVDLDLAKSLYNELQPPANVFLDGESLQAGNWSTNLSDALQRSLISIILISPNTKDAYYVQEEVTIAIHRAIADPHTHQVIPVYVNKSEVKAIPFGLNSKQSLFVNNENEFKNIREKLLKWLSGMKNQEVRKAEVVAQQQSAVESITNPRNSSDLFKGLLEVTGIIRPLMRTLLALLVVTFVLLMIFMVVPVQDRGLLLITTCAIFLLLLMSILLLLSQSLRLAPHIATGNINAG
ncbi:MAG: toll/interleukin-1 receptor domain-containing protein [Panacibacter sp.]